MLRPDGQSQKTTVLLTVVNQKDERLFKAAEMGRDAVDAQKALLREYFQDAGWESERIVAEMMATTDFYYDIVGQVKMERWSKGRVVLLGDAA